MTASIEERLSPDGRYKLIIQSNKTRPGCWNVVDVEVRRTADDALIGTTSRNYPATHVLHFVSQDGVDYLVISEHYHGGYGVMNLATGEKAHFNPNEGRTKDDPYEPFWCWAGPVSHDPEKKELVIVGCYWGMPYDRITFDFSNPMAPPYAILKDEPEPYEDDDDEDV